MKTFKLKMLVVPTHVEIDRAAIDSPALLEMAQALNFNIPLTMLDYDDLDRLLRNFRARMFEAADLKDKSTTIVRSLKPDTYDLEQ